MQWDVFCRVIDNHGDLGVCWRLAAGLAARGERVRLRVDDASALAWMAPAGAAGVEVLPWSSQPPAGDVVIEAFGCELPQDFQGSIAEAARVRGVQPPWINLEYLTAEPFAERNHGLPSPVLAGAARGSTKHFFYPGFTERTGGLIREPGLVARQQSFDRSAWLSARGVAAAGEFLISMFCYEPAAMRALLDQLRESTTPVHLLVTEGRASAALRSLPAATTSGGALRVTYLPLMPQEDFDHLLWSCDFNFVRGEDSLVRALWAGKPFAWQLYPQDDRAHHAKLEAFLDWLGAPGSLRQFHRAWNGTGVSLPALDAAQWQSIATAARDRLLRQDDLVTQLLGFVRQRAKMSSAGS